MIRKDGTISTASSKLNKRNWAYPEYREKMLAVLRKPKKQHSAETTARLGQLTAARNRLRWQDPVHRECMVSMLKSRKISDETRLRLSNAAKGKHRTFSEEHRKNLSLALKGRKKSEAALVHIREAGLKRRGIPLTEECKQKISDKIRGRKLSTEHIRKLSEARKGYKFTGQSLQNIRDGLKRRILVWSPESRLKASISHRGEKCHLWKGGISYELYPPTFGRTIKRLVRERDKHTCQLCFQDIRTMSIHHAIHHIDYDKANCEPNNLILLCHLCHIKTNSNRDWWTSHFKKVMHERKDTDIRVSFPK